MPSVAERVDAATDVAALVTAAVGWQPCHRLIASRYPTVSLFDRIAAPQDLDMVFAVEGLTNPRLRQELGQLCLVPVQDRVVGAGATLIMAAFTHLNPLGSRFSDGSYGVYYAADSLATAVAEVSHHRALFLGRTAEPAMDLDLRWIQADATASLHDLRGARQALPAIYDPLSYADSQRLGQTLRQQGSAGLVYDSVRDPAGQCVALFKPKALGRARPAGHIALHWDGRRVSHWFSKGEPQVL